ncbi:MAG TPA: alpha/beta fold hydrolase [Gemmatimonadaceae bacterium]|nr:alpha/beta fold hydrolase [Gemmatimonadaceae bacterium]
MNKVFLWIVAVLVVLAGAAYGGRIYAKRTMTTRALTPGTLGATTPANVGVPFSRVAITSGERTLIGWLVRAPADSGTSAPALLFLHGNNSAISDYVNLQRFLYRQGITSLVFDYSGFGASGGAPSLTNAVEDAGRVAKVFADSAGVGARTVAMGSALGATVLLQAIDSVQPHVSGIVIEGVDASVLESAVRAGHVPAYLSRVVEDIADNVQAAARVRVPVLAIHSYEDNRTPIADAQRVMAAVSSRASLVRHWRKGHSALLTSTRPCDWAPVLTFVKTGALPPLAFDTTNACAVEAAPMATASARADSVQLPVTPAGSTSTRPR